MKIIFTHLKPEIWQYKVASTLRKRGIKTVSISLKTFDRKMFDKAFSEIISLNLENLKPKTILKELIKKPKKFLKFFYKLLRVKADIAICQGPPHYLPAFFIFLFEKRMPRIYFPYDINVSRFKEPEKYLPRREVWGERYCFKNCDALIYKTDKRELNFVPKSYLKQPKLNFFQYTLKEWHTSKPNKKLPKDLNIVYAGSIIMDHPLYIPMSFHFNKIIKQKIHLHLYPANKISDKEVRMITKNNKPLEKFLHIHKYVSPEKFPKELRKHDFGWWFIGYSNKAKKNILDLMFVGKFSSYLEGGLPIIAHKNPGILSKIIKNNKIGILLRDTDDIANLKSRIKRINYSKMLKSVEKFRKKFTMEENINKLIKFIEQISQKREKKIEANNSKIVYKNL